MEYSFIQNWQSEITNKYNYNNIVHNIINKELTPYIQMLSY